MSSDSDLTEQLRAHFRRERRTIDQHPSPEQIVAYHERRLPSREAEDLRAHLAACRDCTAQLLMLAELLDEEEDTPGFDIPRADLDAAWQWQRARLFPARPAAPLESRRPRGTSPRWAWATAASLGLAAALLAVVVVDQRRTLERLSEPQVNPPLVNLAPVGSVRQGGLAATGLQIPVDAERVWMILNPVADPSSPSYDVEIFAPDGSLVLRFRDLRSSEAGNIRLEIPRGALAVGEHQVLLIGKPDGGSPEPEEFVFRVLSSPTPSP